MTYLSVVSKNNNNHFVKLYTAYKEEYNRLTVLLEYFYKTLKNCLYSLPTFESYLKCKFKVKTLFFSQDKCQKELFICPHKLTLLQT